MYRYRCNGSTSTCLKAADNHLHKVGNLKYVRAYVYYGRHNVNHVAVLVRGDKGSARFAGFSWGYSGEGVRGCKALLEKLNVPQNEIWRVLNCSWNGWDKTGEVWRINT